MKETIGIIGMGRMGRCMVQGLSKKSKDSLKKIRFTTRHKETGEAAAKELGVTRCESNADLVDASDIIVLAVKPQSMAEVLEDMGPVGPEKTIISIAASTPLSQIEDVLGKETAVVRAMPNTPAFVGAAITPLCLNPGAEERDWKRASMVFEALGEVVRVDEKHMDAVTGLSGCGPAYVYVMLESLTEAGIKVGLPRDLATKLSIQTLLGAAKMLRDTGKHPAELKDEVTTPAGCTIDGLVELEEGKLRITLIKAVVAATKRAGTLSSG